MKQIVVIGAGLGGISAAAHLASAGHRVTILDKNAHIGGKLNELKKDGFTFDLGPSILGEFGFRFVDPVLPTTDLGLRTGFISASGVPGIQGTPVPSGPSFADRPTSW